MEDMGLTEHIEENECEDCDRIINDYMKDKSSLCPNYRKNMMVHNKFNMEK